MAKKLKEFKTWLFDKLQDPEYAIAYLNEALVDEDKRVFLLALVDVIEAVSHKKSKSTLAKETKISRPTMYRMLSKTGNPRWENITSVMDAMNLQMSVSPKR